MCAHTQNLHSWRKSLSQNSWTRTRKGILIIESFQACWWDNYGTKVRILEVLLEINYRVINLTTGNEVTPSRHSLAKIPQDHYQAPSHNWQARLWEPAARLREPAARPRGPVAWLQEPVDIPQKPGKISSPTVPGSRTNVIFLLIFKIHILSNTNKCLPTTNPLYFNLQLQKETATTQNTNQVE